MKYNIVITLINFDLLSISLYLSGPGSCQLDSGGPLFKKTLHKNGKIRVVLLGITSKGHSSIGNCGGINNPTHYVRIRKMLPWIKRHINEKSLCFVNSRNNIEKVNSNIVDT